MNHIKTPNGRQNFYPDFLWLRILHFLGDCSVFWFFSCSEREACHHHQSPQMEGAMFTKSKKSQCRHILYIFTHMKMHFHLYTPVTSKTFSTLALSSFRVTFAAVVADTLLSTVWSKPPLWTALCADCTLQSSKEKHWRSRNCVCVIAKTGMRHFSSLENKLAFWWDHIHVILT